MNNPINNPVNNQVDITKLTVVEIKALAFDELVKMEIAQKNLQMLNNELIKKNQPPLESTSTKTPAETPNKNTGRNTEQKHQQE